MTVYSSILLYIYKLLNCPTCFVVEHKRNFNGQVLIPYVCVHSANDPLMMMYRS